MSLFLIIIIIMYPGFMIYINDGNIVLVNIIKDIEELRPPGLQIEVERALSALINLTKRVIKAVFINCA